MNWGSLRTRITSWYVASLAFTLVFFGAALYLGLAHYLDGVLQTSLKDEAISLQQFLPSLPAKGNAWLAGEIKESYAPEVSGRFIRITRGDGEVVFSSGDTRDSNIDASAMPALMRVHCASFRTIRLEKGHTVVLYALPVTAGATRYVVETGASRDPIGNQLRSLLVELLLFAPFTLVAAALGGRILMSRPLQTLVSLTSQAERVGTTSLGKRLPVIASGDELERLSLALNRMITRLEDTLAHNSRFSADVSHELRTPLTILRGEMEHLVAHPDISAESADVLGSMLEEIERMSKIVESLLVISRLDAGGDIDYSRFDLRALAVATTDQMRLVADEKNVLLTAREGEPVMVHADSIRLSRAIVNLVDNAVKYTPPGGHVSVDVWATGQHAILEVSDNGCGILPECLPNIFDRFYRSDRARSRDSGGVGLGLSIVKAICAAHAGEVSVSSAENKGTTVRLQLPIIEPDVNEPPVKLPS